MNKEEQIVEMTKDVDEVMQSRCFHKSCNECEFDCYTACKATMLADALVNDYDYRKASDVVREIINYALSEIQIIISSIKSQEENGIVSEFNCGAKTALEILFKSIAELKKKYTEEQDV